jgi:antirestriction protein ArdC
VYARVTDTIIKLLEQDIVPWRKPWTDRGLPRNLITQRPYSGINLMLLNSLDYEHSLFLTFKQLKTIGGSVNAGEKASFVVFTEMVDKEVEKDGEKKIEKRSMLRYYWLFNIAQCRDIPEKFLPKDVSENTEIANCDAVIDGMPNAPKIAHKKPDAFYVPSEDYINMPRMKSFESSEEYYTVLFHELIHSTGHSSRLNRAEVMNNPKFGTDKYSLEELTAELGACYLRSLCGLDINDMSQNASYIKGWLEVFKGDKRFLIKAASRGQQAVNYIIAPVTENTEEITAHENVEA